jgi:4-amino-4-deoxy-L-arabinose transferase-like glycosyltransferase
MNRHRSLGAIYGVAAVFVLAFVARAVVVDRQGLWADEVFSLATATGHSLEHPSESTDAARGDFSQGERSRPASGWREYLEYEPNLGGVGSVVRAVRLSDTSPPLYYIALHYWIRIFGNTDRALKGFSVLCSILAIPFLAFLARRISGPRAILPACVLFAFAPASLYYSTEGRMYSLGWLLVTMTAAATFKWRLGDSPIKASLLWIMVSVAGFYTHYFFSFAWAAFLFWLLLYPGRARRRAILFVSAVVFLPIAPWYLSVGEQSSAWRVTSGWLEMRPKGWNFFDAVGSALFGHLSGRGIWGGGWRSNWIAMVLFAAIVLTFLFRWRERAFSGKRALIWLWLLAPLAGVLLLDLWQGTYGLVHYRYVSLGLPAAALLAATALAQWPPPIRWSALILIALLWSPRMSNLLAENARCASPYREVGADLSAQLQPGGVVIVQSIPSGVLGVARYSRPDLEIASWVERLRERENEDLARTIEGRGQVILVRAHEVWMDDRVENLLRASCRFVGDYWRGNFHVLEFDPREEPAAPDSLSAEGRTRP